MGQQINFIKRLIGTAVGFCLLGICGFLMYTLIFSVLGLFMRDKFKKQYYVRCIVSTSFRCFLSILALFGLFKIYTKEFEKLRNLKGALVTCNHPSLLDVVIIMSQIKGIQCVVKSKLWENPLIGGVIKAAGYLRNDIDPQLFLEECKKRLALGENILIFPEGTRSKPGQPIKLQRGVGNLALFTETNIQTLKMNCSPVMLVKGEKWYKIPTTPPTFTVIVGRQFNITDYQDKGPRSLRVRALIEDIQNYYNQYLGYE
ncbi:MAG: hypothetical protein K0S74_401 [Chlamydiales bacterium]|jgi:1-acyl-sn-glycerol-3-phosphate acyltransferase|nr:hypothetical protein [Chlamydiales bacterium]